MPMAQSYFTIQTVCELHPWANKQVICVNHVINPHKSIYEKYHEYKFMHMQNLCSRLYEIDTTAGNIC